MIIRRPFAREFVLQVQPSDPLEPVAGGSTLTGALGARGVSYLLTGNRYLLVKPADPLWGNQQDPTKRARRVAQAESSPYFGALEFVPDKDKAVRAYLDKLVDMGLVGYKTREFEDGGSYHYPALLLPGEERLRAGMRFD